MPAGSYPRPLKVSFEVRSMLSFGGFGVAELSMLSLVRRSARKARQAYATRVLSVRLFSAPFLSDFWAKTSRTPLAFGVGEAEDSRMTPRAHKGTTAGARRAASAIQGDSANGVSVPELIDRETGVREIIEILEGMI